MMLPPAPRSHCQLVIVPVLVVDKSVKAAVCVIHPAVSVEIKAATGFGCTTTFLLAVLTIPPVNVVVMVTAKVPGVK